MNDIGLEVREALPEEIDGLVGIQHRAFTRVAAEIGFDPAQMPPVQETAQDVREILRDCPDAVLLAATADDPSDPGKRVPVGTVRGVPGSHGTVDVGRLAVEDGWERKGIGRALMVVLEEAFPQAERFELFTGRDATGPLRLYESLGYVLMRDEEVAPHLFLVWLEKCRTGSVDSRS